MNFHKNFITGKACLGEGKLFRTVQFSYEYYFGTYAWTCLDDRLVRIARHTLCVYTIAPV